MKKVKVEKNAVKEVEKFETVKKERKQRTTKTPEVKIREACITCDNSTLLDRVRDIVSKADKANKKNEEEKFVTAEDFFGASKQTTKKDELLKKFDDMMKELKMMKKMIKKI